MFAGELRRAPVAACPWCLKVQRHRTRAQPRSCKCWCRAVRRSTLSCCARKRPSTAAWCKPLTDTCSTSGRRLSRSTPMTVAGSSRCCAWLWQALWRSVLMRHVRPQFVWGRNRLPATAVGFGRDIFRISDHAQAIMVRLPCAAHRYWARHSGVRAVWAPRHLPSACAHVLLRAGAAALQLRSRGPRASAVRDPQLHQQRPRHNRRGPREHAHDCHATGHGRRLRAGSQSCRLFR